MRVVWEGGICLATSEENEKEIATIMVGCSWSPNAGMDHDVWTLGRQEEI